MKVSKLKMVNDQTFEEASNLGPNLSLAFGWCEEFSSLRSSTNLYGVRWRRSSYVYAIAAAIERQWIFFHSTEGQLGLLLLPILKRSWNINNFNFFQETSASPAAAFLAFVSWVEWSCVHQKGVWVWKREEEFTSAIKYPLNVAVRKDIDLEFIISTESYTVHK